MLPGFTALVRIKAAPPREFPPVNVNLNPASQMQEPLFLTRQVFVNSCPGVISVLSGMVISERKAREKQESVGRTIVLVACGGIGVFVSVGVLVFVGVGVSDGKAKAVWVKPYEKIATAWVCTCSTLNVGVELAVLDDDAPTPKLPNRKKLIMISRCFIAFMLFLFPIYTAISLIILFWSCLLFK